MVNPNDNLPRDLNNHRPSVDESVSNSVRDNPVNDSPNVLIQQQPAPNWQPTIERALNLAEKFFDGVIASRPKQPEQQPQPLMNIITSPPSEESQPTPPQPETPDMDGLAALIPMFEDMPVKDAVGLLTELSESFEGYTVKQVIEEYQQNPSAIITKVFASGTDRPNQ